MTEQQHLSLPEIQRSRFVSFLLCGLSASLYGLVSPNVHWHVLCWFLLVPFLEALEGSNLRRSFSLGWMWGTLIHLICFSWVIDTVQLHSNLNLALSVLAWILFSFYSGIAFGLMALGVRLWVLRLSLPAMLALPISYTAMEYLFPFIFPWHIGAVLYGVLPLIQISDLFGVYGVTALIAFVNGACWDLLRFLQRKRAFPFLPVSLAVLLLVATWAYGTWRMHALEAVRTKAERFTVGLVQPNIRIQERRTARKREDIWSRYRTLSRQVIRQGAELVVWPESALHFAYRPKASPYSASGMLARLVASFEKPLLFGSWSMGADGPMNTAYLLNDRGEYQEQYDKVRLLAFGEYIPFADWFPPVKEWIQGVGDFEPGHRVEPLCSGDVCFGVLICYEAILDGLSRDFINQGGQFLVNITNDVWFGDTKCPEQHLMLASFRAVENRVWMVRVANTGISACVDPFGRIHCRTPLYREAERVCAVELLDVPSVYRRWGDWFPQLFSSLMMILVLVSLWKRSS
jgi:apolipoprotein N-acyltransferase